MSNSKYWPCRRYLIDGPVRNEEVLTKAVLLGEFVAHVCPRTANRRFRSIADIDRFFIAQRSVANDPNRLFGQVPSCKHHSGNFCAITAQKSGLSARGTAVSFPA